MAEDAGASETGAENGDAGSGAEDGTKLKSALASERTKSKTAEARAKAAETELASLKATIAEGKTDAERTAGRIADLETQIKETNMRAMRAEVAASKGLTNAQARRLQGDTIEALEADADELLAAFKPTEGGEAGAAAGGDAANGERKTTSAARPRENLRPGTATSSTEAAPEYDSKTFLAALPRG